MLHAELHHYKSAVVSLVITLVITLTAATNDPDDKILIADIKAFTFNRGKMTNSRKGSPMPQMTCVGGTAQCKVTPDSIQCVNKGSDGSSFQVDCTASMRRGYSMGRVHVACEDYDSPPNGKYILKGSCWLEYNVEWTGGGHPPKHIDEKDKQYVVGSFIVLIILALLVCLIISACQNKRSQPFTPTYVQAPPPPPPMYGGYGAPVYGPPPSYGYQGGGGGIGGGGFMTGAATGGLLGYMAGRSNLFGGNDRCDSGGWGGGGGTCDSFEPGFDDIVETSGFGEISTS